LRPFRDSDRHADRFHWYGSDGGSPELIISRVIFSIDGKDITIPPHIYGRHGDFAIQGTPLSLLAHGNDLILRYGGSDAAGAYFLDIVASEKGIKSSNTYTHNPISGHFEREAEQTAHTNPLPAPSRSLNENYKP